MNNDFLDKVKIHGIAEKGKLIYSRIKSQYEQKYMGKYLAIDINSGKTYLGETSSDAALAGEKENPDTLYYLLRIGYETALTIAHGYRIS